MSTSRRSRSARPQGHRSPATTEGLLFPLDAVYEQAGVEPPVARRIPADRVPLPYRRLLDHTSDMTLTLERHIGARVALRILSARRSGPWYYRRVLLVHGGSGRPVEMGAIRLRLGEFSARIRAQILQAQAPLGRLLRDGGVDFESRPRAFMALTPNAEMMGVFWMAEPQTLYGRRTEVMLGGAKIGDIVEIVPLAS
jgi:chorismate-pyruvate lyase